MSSVLYRDVAQDYPVAVRAEGMCLYSDSGSLALISLQTKKEKRRLRPKKNPHRESRQLLDELVGKLDTIFKTVFHV